VRAASPFAHPGLLFAGAAAFAMSTLFSALKPILLTRFLEETSWGESLAGLAVAMPFIGIAVSSLLFYFHPPVRSLRSLALIFGGALVACEVLSALYFQEALLLLVLQFGGGFCVGALMAATSNRVAVAHASAATFGFIDMLAVALMSAMVAGAGRSVEYGGLEGGYYFAAILALIYTLVMLFSHTPDTARLDPLQRTGSLALSVRPVAAVTMGVLFVTFSGLGFAFMFTLAANLGMGYEEAGGTIGWILLASALACLLGGYCGERFGARYTLLTGFVFCALGWSLAVHAATPAQLLFGLVPAVFALQFNFPVLLALAGSLDDAGRWAGIAAPLITSGFAWAAILAGNLVEHAGLDALATATVLGMLLCALLLVPATAATEAVFAQPGD
jgi:hypothetical protein